MTASAFLSQLLQLGVALLLAPLLAGWVSQCRAWLQNKSAPSLLLPYRTIHKLFIKDAIVAHNASPIFRVAPYIVFGAMCCAAATFRATIAWGRTVWRFLPFSRCTIL